MNAFSEAILYERHNRSMSRGYNHDVNLFVYNGLSGKQSHCSGCSSQSLWLLSWWEKHQFRQLNGNNHLRVVSGGSQIAKCQPFSSAATQKSVPPTGIIDSPSQTTQSWCIRKLNLTVLAPLAEAAQIMQKVSTTGAVQDRRLIDVQAPVWHAHHASQSLL